MAPDARKTLAQLRNEWHECERCDLGVQRKSNGGNFVFGEGIRHGVMFVSEGPGWKEEADGRPLTGKPGILLRDVLAKLGLVEAYFTHCVCCRSCVALVDDSGLPIYKSFYGKKRQMFRDEPPLPTHVQACRERLYEEIYLVDPVLIVTLGVKPAEILTGGNFAITTERGKERTIEVPGATNRPVLTDKKGAWARKVKGKFVMPTETNMVRYLMLPTFQPSYVMRKISDESERGPFAMFAQDLRNAVKVYERYMMEAHGVMPSGSSDIPEEILMRVKDEEEDADY